jgi:simple sugar transport system permease protein
MFEANARFFSGVGQFFVKLAIVTWEILKTPITYNQMLRSATPVALAALGGLLTEHAGIMNIGMDGMILMGAFVAALASYYLASAALGVLAVIIFGILIGLFFALFAVKWRSDEFIIGCALNTLALGLTTVLCEEIFHSSSTSAFNVPSLPDVSIPLIKDIPFVGEAIGKHSLFVYLTILLVFVMWFFVYRTPVGLWIRAAGESPETLRTAGKNPERMKWIASILCGVFCGLAGAHLSLGNLNGVFTENMVNERGYIAFACVIFSAANPKKAYLAALMFGFFEAYGMRLQVHMSMFEGILDPKLPYAELTKAIPYVITIIMMVYVVDSGQRRRERMAKKQLRSLETK